MNALVQPQVSIINNVAKTTSIAVSEFFHKLHKNVLKAIDTLKADLDPVFYALNFELIQNEVNLGMGRTRLDRAYQMTKDGFTLLALGFTGKDALAFKVSYIQRFNEMEAALKAAPEIPSNPHLILRQTIAQTAKGDRRLYKALYSRLYHQFQVTSYKHIPTQQCASAIEFIKTVQGEYIARDKISAPKPSLALCDGQHYVVAKDGAVLLHKVLSHDINDSCLKSVGIGQDKFEALKKDLAHFFAPEDPHLQITYSTAQHALSMMIALITRLEEHGFKLGLMYQKLDYVKLLLINYGTRLDEANIQLNIVQRLLSRTQHPTVVSGQGVKFS